MLRSHAGIMWLAIRLLEQLSYSRQSQASYYSSGIFLFKGTGLEYVSDSFI